MKKFISMLSALTMSFSIVTASFANDINFSDVTKDDWFYDDIKTVVEMGLINGKSNDRYAPNDNLTYAEAIKLAACMNQFYTSGAVTLANGNPWYQPYVDYCMTKGIIDKTYNYEESATRAGYMTIFANALPDEALQAINTVPDNAIPDVPVTKDYASAVYKLYRAGILNGVDDEYNCEPLVNISRKEVAVIVARMMYEKKRTHFTIVQIDTEQSDEDNTKQGENLEYVDNETTTFEALIFSKTPSDVTVYCGETATFQTEVLSGRKPFTYRWQYLKDGSWIDFEDTADEKTSITGATETTLTVVNSVPDVTELRCVVTDSVGKEHATQTAKLMVVYDGSQAGEWSVIGNYTTNDNDADDTADDEVDDTADDKVEPEDDTASVETAAPAELKIEIQPSSVTVALEKDDVFTVEVSGGTAPYTYQWQLMTQVKNRSHWININNREGTFAGTDTAELTITGAEPLEAAVRCVITDNAGNQINSKSAKVVITDGKSVLPSGRRSL